LKQAGGRPSREIRPDPGPWDGLGDEELHALNHWDREWKRCQFELERWENFQKYQQAVRKDPEKFRESVEKIREQVELQFQLDEQTPLDTWKEYYLYEHRVLAVLEARVERAQKEVGPAQEELKAAESAGLTEAELNQKLTEAHNRWRSVEKRLEALQSDESRRTMEIAQARVELEVAQKRYSEAHRAERLRGRLKDAARGATMREAERKVEEQTAWVKSIEALPPAIAAEQAGSSQETENHLDNHHRQDEAEVLPAKPASKLARSKGSKLDKREHATRSVLDPVDASKVSKASRRDGRRQPKQKPSQGTSLLIESHSGDRAQDTTATQDTENRDNRSQVRESRLRELRNRTASEASPPNGSSRGSGLKGKRPTARSILSPVDPSRVYRKKSGPTRQTRYIPSDTSLPAEKATIDRSSPQRSSKRMSKLKDNIPARGLESTSLGPIHSSRVSKARMKAGGTQPTEVHVNVTKVPQITDRRRNKRPAQQATPADTPPRRSTRVSRKPERFCPG
jgi:hypothetical protein